MSSSHEHLRMLITGGTGYLGAYFVDHFNPTIHKDHGISHLAFTYTSVEDSTLPHYFESPVVGDVRLLSYRVDLSDASSKLFLDFETFVTDFEPDIVIHLAAKTQSTISYADAYPTNVEGTRNLCTALSKCSRIPHLVVFSTDWVYGAVAGKSLLKETDSATPEQSSGFYGKTKLESELLIQKEFPEVWARTMVLRSALVLGSHRLNRKRATFLQWLYDRLVAEERGSRQRSEIFSDEYRSVIFLPDILDLMQRIVTLVKENKEASVFGQTYNMGGPMRLTRYALACALCRASGMDPDERVKPVTLAEAGLADQRPGDLSMDSSKLERAFPGWKRTQLEEGIQWFLQELQRVNALTHGSVQVGLK